VLLDVLHTIIVGCGAVGDYQIIVLDTTDRRFNVILFRLDLGHFAQPKEKVVVAGKSFPKGKNDGAGLQPRSCYLIEQRLKTMVIIFVEENRLSGKSTQSVSNLQTAKPTSDNNYSWFAQVSDSSSRGD
jgi:hypothetical protein